MYGVKMTSEPKEATGPKRNPKTKEPPAPALSGGLGVRQGRPGRLRAGGAGEQVEAPEGDEPARRE